MIVLLLLLLLAPVAAEASSSAADSVAPDSTVIADGAGAAPVAHPAASLDSVILLPEVRVDRARPLSDVRRRAPTGFVTELRPGSSGRAIESLSDVLEEAAGVHVVQYGGLGAFSTVSVRGANANQVTVYLDGMALSSPARSVVNLSDLPFTAVERVEVTRGPAGSADGPGGAVHLATLPATTSRMARAAGGSWNAWEARGSTVLGRGPIAGVLHVGYQGADGDYPFLDDNGTPHNAGDDSVSRRINNRFDATSALAGLSWRPAPTVRLGLRGLLFHKAQGVPGLGAVPAAHPRLATDRGLGTLEALWLGRGRWPRVSLRAGLLRERTRFGDARAELGLGRHDTDDRIHGEELAVEVESQPLPGGFVPEGEAGVRGDRLRVQDAADGHADPPPSRRTTRRASLGLRWQPLGDVLTLHAWRRWDRLIDRLHGLGVAGTPLTSETARELGAPRLGVAVRGRSGLEARANWSRARRAPDFTELFGNQGTVLGNPSLRPEDVESWDVGGAWSAPIRRGFSGAVEWAHFESHARDLILYVRNSASTARAQNVSCARVRGEELSLRLAGPGGVSARGGATWQSAVDESDVPYWHGRRLPQRPGREAFARVGWRGRRLELGADLHHLGDNYLDRYNRERVASRTLVGASISLTPFVSGLRLTVEGRNLGDRRVSDVAGYPLPGRSVFVACEARLGEPQP